MYQQTRISNQAAPHQEHRLLQTILDKAPIGLFTLQLIDKARMEFRVLNVNDYNSFIAGVALKPFIGKLLREAFPTVYEGEAQLPKAYVKALDTQQEVEVGEMEYGDDKIARQLFYFRVVPLDGSTVLVTTENRTRILREKEKLKRANRVLKEFSDIISHELREPIRTIATFSQLLSTHHADSQDASVQEFTNYIAKASKHLDHLMGTLLNYSQVGTGSERGIVDCNLVMKERLFNNREAIANSRAEIQVDTMPIVEGYPAELAMLFRQLLLNALAYTKPGVPPRIVVSAERSGPSWLFTFRDNGIGIPESAHTTIFSLRERLHVRDEFKQMGIGLAICKKVIDMHGGEIWVESRPGHGSTFYFTIPER
jgi:signal transduction histidine kinase